MYSLLEHQYSPVFARGQALQPSLGCRYRSPAELCGDVSAYLLFNNGFITNLPNLSEPPLCILITLDYMIQKMLQSLVQTTSIFQQMCLLFCKQHAEGTSKLCKTSVLALLAECPNVQIDLYDVTHSRDPSVHHILGNKRSILRQMSSQPLFLLSVFVQNIQQKRDERHMAHAAQQHGEGLQRKYQLKALMTQVVSDIRARVSHRRCINDRISGFSGSFW